MLSLTLIALCLGQAESSPPREERIELVGISEGEGVAAFNVGVKAPRGNGRNGITDAYEVTRLIALASGEVVATFRRGHGSSHPEWQRAAPASEFRAVARKLRRKPKRLPADDGAVWVQLDPDVRLAGSFEDKSFVLSGAPGSPVGFMPVARLYDGRYVPLAHLRVAGVSERAVKASLEVFHSATGMNVIMITRFTSEHAGKAKRHDVVRVARMPDSPLGTTRLGVFRVAAEFEGEVSGLYGQLHPEGKAEFRQFAR